MWLGDFAFSRPQIIFFSGLAVFCASLPLSNFGMSLGQIIMLFGWLSDGSTLRKIKDFFRTPPYLVWSVFYLLLLASMLYGGNLKDGLDDARVKISFFLLPLFFSGFEDKLNRDLIKGFLWIYVAAVILSFIISLSCYFEFLDIAQDHSKRFSPFISHIRLSLMGVLAIVFLSSEVGPAKRSLVKLVCAMGCIVILFGMIKLAWFSGLSILGFVFLLFCFYRFFRTEARAFERVLWLLTAIAPFIFCVWLFKNNIGKFYHSAGPPMAILKQTPNGRLFEQHPELKFTENGYRFGDNIQWEELKSAYLKRTGRSTELKNVSGWKEEMVLMRYLTSKNLTKDSAGIFSLSEKDLENIRQGIPNFLLDSKTDFQKKLYELTIEFQTLRAGLNSGGHSVSMRFFAWKRAISMIKESPFIGYGIAGVREAFRNSYRNDASEVPEGQKIRAHQQFLTLILCLGIPLGVLSVALFFWVPFRYRNTLPANYLFFWLVPICSMFSEDTLETQAGVSFSIFAFLILLPLRKELLLNRDRNT